MSLYRTTRSSNFKQLWRWEGTLNGPVSIQETLEAQLNYVISGFANKSAEVIQAAALAFRFLGTDCAKLLGGHIGQLHQSTRACLTNEDI